MYCCLEGMFLPNDDFCASPIYIKDDAYEFSIDPEVITLVDAFHDHENENIVDHICKFQTLVTSAKKVTNQHYFMLKLFPFHLKMMLKLG